MKKIFLILACAIVPVGGLAATADQLIVAQPLVRLVPPGSKVSAAFMVLRNEGDRDAKLLSASSPVARVVELHNHINDNGVMRMRPVAEVEIKGHGETALRPGGLHLMLIDLQAPLQEGASVPLTLKFEDGSSKKVDAPVVRPGEQPQMHGEHKH